MHSTPSLEAWWIYLPLNAENKFTDTRSIANTYVLIVSRVYGKLHRKSMSATLIVTRLRYLLRSCGRKRQRQLHMRISSRQPNRKRESASRGREKSIAVYTHVSTVWLRIITPERSSCDTWKMENPCVVGVTRRHACLVRRDWSELDISFSFFRLSVRRYWMAFLAAS